MKLTTHLVICCIFMRTEWTASQKMDCKLAAECLTSNGKKGTLVLITNCPHLLEIARRPIITTKMRRYLEAHICRNQIVCCEKPITTTTTTAAPITTSEPHFGDIPLPSTTAPTRIASDRIPEPDFAESPQYSSLLPKENDCGLDPASQRISDGNSTKIDQFRWTVALDYNISWRRGILCGGSLINTRYVLTAAHCVYRVPRQAITLRLGEWDIKQTPDCDEYKDCNPEERFEKVSEIIVHPEYVRINKSNDIALLRLEHALPENYTSHILPICLPWSTELMHDSFVNREVSVVGWGRTENGTRSRYKMYINITTISNQKCEQEQEKHMSDRVLCAKSLSSTKRDACKGDSGGPLQVHINGTYYLIGIISHGPPCGRTTLPAVYTRVTSYMDWIWKTISA